MAYGFDPGLPLSMMPRPPQEASLNETLRTMADLAQSRTQQQQAQATLADMLRKQQQERTLAQLYQANAERPEALPAAMMRAGFGGPAFEIMGRQSEIASRKASADKMASSIYEAGLQRLRGRASVVKTPEQYDQLIAPIPVDERAQLGLPDQYDPAALEGFIAGGIPAGKQLSPEEADARAARAEYERAKAAALKRGPSMDPAKAENLRLRNEKLTQELGGGGPSKLSKIEGYVQREGFEVKPTDVEKLRDAQAQSRTMKKNVDQLMTLYQKYGNEILPGPVRARMSAIATHLQLKAKGKTMFELGVIAGPDMGLLNSVIADPTKKEATIADFFSGGGGDASESMEKLRVMREQLDENFQAAAWSRGYDPEKKSGGSPPKKVTSDAEYRALPSGAEFLDPNGVRRRKP